MCLLLSVDVHKPRMPLNSALTRRNEAIRRVYRSVIISKLLYAVSAWWCFASAADRQRLQALLHRGIRSNLYSIEIPCPKEPVASCTTISCFAPLAARTARTCV